MRTGSANLRRALNWSYLASAVWAAGNVLAGGVLVNFLAQELGARGRELAWLGAAPALVGLLQLFTPALIVRFGNAKRLCLSTSLVSYAILAGLPVLAFARISDGHRPLLLALIGVYCLHQLLEQVATVALFTWLGDLVPRRLLGRYFGRRNFIQMLVVVLTLLGSDQASKYLGTVYPGEKILPYAWLTAVGTACYFAAMAALAAVPATAPRGTGRRTTLAEVIAPLKFAPSRRLLAYNCWFSFFNGLTTTPQQMYPKMVLGLAREPVQWMAAAMRLGQAAISPIVGPVSDRRGNVPVLVVSQVAVGAAPLFFLWADSGHPNRLYGAYLLWSFYAGINICLPNLTMLLAPPGGQAPYLAAYRASSSLMLTAGTLVGGYLFEWLRDNDVAVPLGAMQLDPFALAFIFAFVTRTAGALLLLRVDERSRSS